MVHLARPGRYLPRQGPATLEQFIRSRDIINGTDKEKLIGENAVLFQTALERGGWRVGQ